MSTLLEIEQAARQLSPSEQAILIQRLQQEIKKEPRQPEAKAVKPAQGKVEWPDFAARLRAVYGDRVIPNMVLEDRAMSDR